MVAASEPVGSAFVSVQDLATAALGQLAPSAYVSAGRVLAAEKAE